MSLIATDQCRVNGDHHTVEPASPTATAVGIERLQQENRQLRVQIEELADAWDSVRFDVGEECAVRERLQASLQEARDEAEAERSARQAADRRAEAAEAEAAKSASSMAALTERCDRALRERAELRTGTAELRAKLEAAVRELDKFREENAELKAQLHAMSALQTPQSTPQLSPQPLKLSNNQRQADGCDVESIRRLKQEVGAMRSSALPESSSGKSKGLISNSNPSRSSNGPFEPANHRRASSPSDRRRIADPRAVQSSGSRRFSAAVDKVNDDAIVLGGSAMLVRLHRLERENKALRRRLDIPKDSSLPASVFYAARRDSSGQTQVPDVRIGHVEARRLNVERWTARHAQLKQLLEDRFGCS